MLTWRRRISRNRSILRLRIRKKKKAIKTIKTIKTKQKKLTMRVIINTRNMEKSPNATILILKKSKMSIIPPIKVIKVVITIKHITTKSMNEKISVFLFFEVYHECSFY